MHDLLARVRPRDDVQRQRDGAVRVGDGKTNTDRPEVDPEHTRHLDSAPSACCSATLSASSRPSEFPPPPIARSGLLPPARPPIRVAASEMIALASIPSVFDTAATRFAPPLLALPSTTTDGPSLSR